MSIVPSPAVLRVWWWLSSNMCAERSVVVASVVLAPLYGLILRACPRKTTFGEK